jgi:hypothetical protein
VTSHPPVKKRSGGEKETGESTDDILTRGGLFSHGSIWLFCVLAALAGVLIGVFVGFVLADVPFQKQSDLPTMSQCVAETLKLFSQNSTTADTLRDAREHCNSLIQAQGTLTDFAIRKLNYVQQYRANGVLMWMVVSITLSGAFLAGLQLWASYQLASVNRKQWNMTDGKLVLTHDRLVLKSSVTGLLILLTSFCFFLVFVLYVYRFEALPEQASAATPPVSVLSTDGLGSPLQKDKR